MNPVKCRNSDMKHLCPRLAIKSTSAKQIFLLVALVTLLSAAGNRN